MTKIAAKDIKVGDTVRLSSVISARVRMVEHLDDVVLLKLVGLSVARGFSAGYLLEVEPSNS